MDDSIKDPETLEGVTKIAPIPNIDVPDQGADTSQDQNPEVKQLELILEELKKLNEAKPKTQERELSDAEKQTALLQKILEKLDTPAVAFQPGQPQTVGQHFENSEQFGQQDQGQQQGPQGDLFDLAMQDPFYLNGMDPTQFNIPQPPVGPPNAGALPKLDPEEKEKRRKAFIDNKIKSQQERKRKRQLETPLAPEFADEDQAQSGGFFNVPDKPDFDQEPNEPDDSDLQNDEPQVADTILDGGQQEKVKGAKQRPEQPAGMTRAQQDKVRGAKWRARRPGEIFPEGQSIPDEQPEQVPDPDGGQAVGQAVGQIGQELAKGNQATLQTMGNTTQAMQQIVQQQQQFQQQLQGIDQQLGQIMEALQQMSKVPTTARAQRAGTGY